MKFDVLDFMNPIVRMLRSSKALVMLGAIVFTTVVVLMGKATFEDATDFLKWVIGPWLIAVGAEDAAKHMSHKKSSAPVAVAVAGEDAVRDTKLTIPMPPPEK